MVRAAALAVAVSALVVACARPRQESATSHQSPLDSVLRVVQTLTSDRACDDVSQCRAMAFGAKPCGGPWRYLVYSIRTTDSARLAEAVGAYNAAEAELNRQEGRMSDCRVVEMPTLACRMGACVAIGGP
jgi:hypothetical protein